MPDWLAHIGFAYLIIWGISKVDRYDAKFRKYYLFFFIGGVMPDLERIFALTAEFIHNYQLKEFFSAVLTSSSHTILGVIVLSLALTSFFTEENPKWVFIAFFFGGMAHLLLDAIMWPWPNMGLLLFYPFLVGPRFTYSFHLVWPGGFLPLIVISCAVGISLIIDIIQKKTLLTITPLRAFIRKNR
ncbi:MAG: metal-dependent hydrolase [Candidatus Helarchaeota archaeon]